MKIRVAALIFTAVFLVQGTLLNMVALWGATPNLILCLVIALTFFYENEQAIYLGVAFGIISDICFSDMIGIASMGYLVLGFILVKVRSTLNKESLISSVILGMAGTLFFNFFCWALRQLLGSSYDFVHFLKLQPLYVFYNLIVMIFLYYFLINRVVRHRSDRYYR